MSYLLDRKAKRKKMSGIAAAVVLAVLIFYFRAGVFTGLSSVAAVVFRPVQNVAGNAVSALGSFRSYFMTKRHLYRENEALRQEILSRNALVADYDVIVRENETLKTALGRMPEERKFLLAAILAKPNQSPYDTLTIDVGENAGVRAGDVVFAVGDVPVGRVDAAASDTSRVVLFSSASEKTQVIIPVSLAAGAHSDVFWEIIGRGGGNFEMILPRDFELAQGDSAIMPGVAPHAVAVTEAILSDPRDPFKKALLRSPVNIQDLKHVYVDTGR